MQEYTTLEDAISQQGEENKRLGRTQPFILRFGTSYFFIADCKPIVVKPSSPSVAIDTLYKSYYVMNLEFPAQTSVMHNFMVQFILQIKSNMTAKAMKLFAEIADD
jgi:hypothetical protein